MLRDYLRSTLRNSLKHKLFTCITIVGLALGLAVFFAVTLYIRTELSFDVQWQDADRIYRVNTAIENAGGDSSSIYTGTPYVLGSTVQTLFPESIEQWLRFYTRGNNIVIDEKTVRIPVHLAEKHVLELLQLKTVAGDLQLVFANPAALAINDQYAQQYFGEESPLGKRISVVLDRGNRVEYTIEAVFSVPGLSSVSQLNSYLGLLDANAMPEWTGRLDAWSLPGDTQPVQVANFVKLRAGTDPTMLERSLREYMDEGKVMIDGSIRTRFRLQRLQDIHLNPRSQGGEGNVYRLQVFAAIGALVLIIGGCNFVMLTTVRAADRLREVGVRKAVGSTVRQLAQQYLLDAFCHTLLAALLAVAMVELMKPTLASSVQMTLISFPLWQNLVLFAASVMLFALLSGAYPALLLAHGRPGVLLRNGGSSLVARGNGLRKALVGLQFAIVITLLLASAVVYRQIEYTRNRDPGFSLDNVMRMIVGDRDAQKQLEPLAEEFRKLEGVEAVVVGGMMSGMLIISAPTVFSTVGEESERHEAGLSFAMAGYGYFDLLEIEILAGREFIATMDVPDQGEQENRGETRILLNNAAVHGLGFASAADAVGQLLQAEGESADGLPNRDLYRVIGVAEDTQLLSVMRPPVAEFYQLTTSGPLVAIKLQPDASVDYVRQQLEQRWKAVVGDFPFSVAFADEGLNILQREESEARIIIVCTALALIIACMGLYGLVAATALKRVKEIGIRKALGAERNGLIRMLLWQFSKPVVLANIAALPLGFWGVSQWLQRFPYQLDTRIILMTGVGASGVALLVAWLTVSVIAARAANARPVLALKYE